MFRFVLQSPHTLLLPSNDSPSLFFLGTGQLNFLSGFPDRQVMTLELSRGSDLSSLCGEIELELLIGGRDVNLPPKFGRFFFTFEMRLRSYLIISYWASSSIFLIEPVFE